MNKNNNKISLQIATTLLLIIISFNAIQYFFLIKPCLLCKIQQFLYIIIFFISLAECQLEKIHFIKFIIILLIVNTIINIYKIDLENGLYLFKINFCEIENDYLKRTILKSNKLNKCQNIQKIFGIKLSNYNLLINFILIILLLKKYPINKKYFL